jgi:hypothetical protein
VFEEVLKALLLQVRHPSLLLLVQEAQVGWQVKATQFPLTSNWNPLMHEQVPSLFKKAFTLQLLHPLTFALLQLSHLLLQFKQLPLTSMKNPLLQTQLLVFSLMAFDLQVRQFTFVGPKQVEQVLWHGTLMQLPVAESKVKPELHVHSPVESLKALFLQPRHWLVFGPEQVEQVLWQVVQTPFEFIKVPALQMQDLWELRKAFVLQLRHEVLAESEQVKQV